MLCLNAVSAQCHCWKMFEIPCDNEFTTTVNGRRQDLAIVHIGKSQIVYSIFISRNQCFTCFGIHLATSVF